jgi:hypothetical protein
MTNDWDMRGWNCSRHNIIQIIRRSCRFLGLLATFGITAFAQRGGGGGGVSVLFALAGIILALFFLGWILRALWRFLQRLFGPRRHAIFISYRRQDCADVTGRLTDALAQRFGKHSIFRDVDDIGVGDNFRKQIELAMAKCRVALVIIGNHWAGGGLGASGETRLDSPRDLVRIEVEVALARKGVTVIPVLVMGAPMPEENTLPPTLRGLADINAVSIRGDPDFPRDVERLIQGIGRRVRIARRA